MTPINQLLQIREIIINIYKRYERIILPILKFISVLVVLLLINKNMGYAKSLNKIPVSIVFSMIGVFLSPQLLMLMFIILMSIHAGVASMEMGIIVFALFIIIYLLYIRLYPKESLFIVGTIVAYKLHIPYIVPLIAGLFSTLSATVAVVIGVCIWYCAPQIMIMMQGKAADIGDIIEVINTNITALQQTFKTDQTMLASIVILSIVLITINIIRKQAIDYAEYIAILVGSVMNIVGFLFAIILLKADVSTTFLILSTIISAFIVTIMQFFSKVADYSRAEKVQFEDSKNYYYVKIVPKIIVNPTKKHSKYISTRGK